MNSLNSSKAVNVKHFSSNTKDKIIIQCTINKKIVSKLVDNVMLIMLGLLFMIIIGYIAYEIVMGIPSLFDYVDEFGLIKGIGNLLFDRSIS